ncbi:MAG: branched-chain amino acid ABC transporter permease [Burkholderiaceae bacterium]|nr:branched-chain amino acid ABC transporter permease [Burkholderiaceae bacterium]
MMLVAGLAVLPLVISNEYALSIITLTLLYAYLALAWNLIGGIAGQLSLGHAAYFGVGSYTSTLMFLHLGISPWLGMLVGAALAAVAALIIGLSCFRLRGAYFALATLAAAMIFKIVAENSQTALGGPGGLAVKLLRDAPLQFQHTRREFYYVVIVVLAAIAVLLNHAVLRSRLGHYLVAIRNDHDAARALGVDTTRCKLAALVLSAALTAVGGTFYAQFMLYISPDKVFGANLSVQIAVMCIIGGRATVWGPVLGALLLFSAEEGTRYLTGGTIGVDMMLYGLLLMAVIRLEPRGVYRSLQDARQRWMTRSRAGAH